MSRSVQQRFACLRRWALGVAAVCAFFGGSAATARAEEVFTAQAAAANATESTWIPAPAQRAAVCIVDTGVTPNPDTANVVARFAIDGGSPDDVDLVGHHGTLMAMIASAPYNGFGMVGAAPSVNVVSVRAMRPGAGGFFFTDVLTGLSVCLKQRAQFNIRVISLSLGADGTLDPGTAGQLRSRVDLARTQDVSVVAASGNHSGPVEMPASYGPVVAVGASDPTGQRCAFSGAGPEVDIYVVGCPEDVALPDGRPAWAEGTSGAAAFAAAVLAQLRGLRPDLAMAEAERLVSVSARDAAAGPLLDVAAALADAGLGPQLALGRAAQPGAASPSGLSVTAVGDASHATARPMVEPAPSARRLPKPRVRRVRYAHGRLDVALRGRPRSAKARVTLYVRAQRAAFPKSRRVVRMKGSRLRIRIRGALIQISINYVDPSGRLMPSAPLILSP